MANSEVQAGEREKVSDCYVCRKHRGELSVPGGPVYENALLYAGHASIPEGEAGAYLGALLVEPKRHVAGFAELSGDEARGIGPLIGRLSQALISTEGAEHVYLFVLGHHSSHLHVWLVPRYPGTPREFWGMRVDEWPGAPKGGADEIAALCQRIRDHMAQERG